MPDPAPELNQRDYWNSNLDPQNLSGRFEATGFDYGTESVFYLTPDQRDALDHFAPLGGKLLLEVGAGIGMNALYTARQGATTVAVDIARERLRALRDLAARAGVGSGGAPGRVWPVQCSAEALPFRAGAFDCACSKSVLIHTDLERAVSELARTLRDGGTGAFIEPMTRNPLVNLYRRTLAPQEWRSITRYFAEPEFDVFRGAFAGAEIRRWYVLSFLAFVWQFGVRAPRLFRPALAATVAADRVLTGVFPSLRRYSWFAVIRVRKSGGAVSAGRE